MTKNKHDYISDVEVRDRAAALMDQYVRPDLLDKMVQLAIDKGSEKIDTFRGSGYLELKDKPLRPKHPIPEMYRVVYEIDILSNPELMHTSALGCMVGNHSVLEHGMRSGAGLKYAAESAPLDIEILQVESNRAFFKVLTPMAL
jgi:hypothetical protein